MPERPPAPLELVRKDGTAAPSWGDRRGYSWEQFRVGNLAAATHGARSDRLVSKRAEEVFAALLEVAPWVTDLDRAAVARYTRNEARATMLSDYVARVGAEQGPEHVPPTLWDSATRADLAADKLAGALGLTPESRARLLKDVGQAQHYTGASLGDLAAEGRSLRLAAEARSEGPAAAADPPTGEPAL